MTQTAEALNPADYLTMPLALFTITDLTDALGIDNAVKLLGCNRRYVYVVRNSNALAVSRVVELINAVQADETECRRRLVVQRNAQAQRKKRQRA